MRIIAGEFRGRHLIEPRFDTTRPITDRAKQSLFDILSPTLDDAVVYDCFCGTGSMGLECLSRGAKHATFFDADRHALAGLKTNIQTLGVQGRAKIVAGDIFRAIPPVVSEMKQDEEALDPLPAPDPLATPQRELRIRDSRRGVANLHPSSAAPRTVTLLFFDPPYPFLRDKPDKLLDLMQRLLQHRLAPDATIVFRHDTADALIFPGTRQTDLRTYGGMAIEILRPANISPPVE